MGFRDVRVLFLGGVLRWKKFKKIPQKNKIKVKNNRLLLW